MPLDEETLSTNEPEADELPGSEAEALPTVETTEAVEPADVEPDAAGFDAGWLIWGAALVVAVLVVVVAVLLRRQPSGSGKAEGKARKRGKASGSGDQPVKVPELAVSSAQSIGTRADQEDALGCSDWQDPASVARDGFFAAVSDGIGGLDDGQVASHAAIQVMQKRFSELPSSMKPSDRLLEMCASAHKEVQRINAEGVRSGATLVSLLISGWDMWLLSIGDSRIYLYRSGALLLLNRAHTFGSQAAERSSFAGTESRVDEKRGRALTAFLGQENLTNIDRTVEPMRLMPGDKLLLMSDGVFGTLSEDEIMAWLRLDPAATASAIVGAVDAKGKTSQDNASVIVVSVN